MTDPEAGQNSLEWTMFAILLTSTINIHRSADGRIVLTSRLTSLLEMQKYAEKAGRHPEAIITYL